MNKFKLKVLTNSNNNSLIINKINKIIVKTKLNK